MAKFVRSALAVQGFTGWDPGPADGTTRQATLKHHPTQHNQEALRLDYTTMYQGALRRKGKRNKKS